MKRVGVDVGGTFTDLIVYDEQTRQLHRAKVPSVPGAPEQGVVIAFEAGGVLSGDTSYVIHGTTLVTNLILERKGAKVGLITTAGFRDILEIMRASRPRPYDIAWIKPAPIVPRYLRREVRERVDSSGKVLVPLDSADAEFVVRQLLNDGVEAIAVCFLHSYANPQHEREMVEIIRAISPDVHVTISSDICRQIREYERTSTVALNAYAMPRVARYVRDLDRDLSVNHGVRYMNSAGGVTPAEEVERVPVALALSGPAGGVLGGRFLGEALRLKDIITMDMGGTSLDVCVIRDGRPQLESSFEVDWGIPLLLPALQINTIGAGGGSIVWVDEGDGLQVGPESAGAVPGPACYGKGGERPTVTDANLVLGLLSADYFLGGRFPVDYDKAITVIQAIADHYGIGVGEAAEGIYRVVNAKMAQAIRRITVDRGIDPRDFTLICFGGAGGQHAVAVAREASVGHIVLPVASSVFSALGMITADVSVSRSYALLRPLDDLDMRNLSLVFDDLEAEARKLVSAVGDNTTTVRTMDLRYRSQSHELSILLDPTDTIKSVYKRFEDQHERLYGSRLGHPVDVITLHSTMVSKVEPIELPPAGGRKRKALPYRYRRIHLYSEEVPVFRREELPVGYELITPSIVEEEDSTYFLPAGSKALADKYGNILVTPGEE